MKSSEFFNKFKSRYLWGNLAAMVVVVILLCFGVKVGLDVYTHHGESIAVPNVKYKLFADAEHILKDKQLRVVVTDTGYVKTLPADCILEQTPDAGTGVKSGHTVYVTVNAVHTPTISLPDIIDNSSLREAMAKLTAMGFKLGQPEFVPGERDWVYGVTANGRHVVKGDKVSVDETLIIQVGNGQLSATDSVEYVDPVYPDEEMEEGDVDDFVEVTAPPSEEVKSSPSVPSAKPTRSKADGKTNGKVN